MDRILKWLLRTALQGIVWVFILSISVDGRPLFSHAQDVLVQNTVVRAVDEQLAELWQKAREMAKLTFDSPTTDSKDKTNF